MNVLQPSTASASDARRGRPCARSSPAWRPPIKPQLAALEKATGPAWPASCWLSASTEERGESEEEEAAAGCAVDQRGLARGALAGVALTSQQPLSSAPLPQRAPFAPSSLPSPPSKHFAGRAKTHSLSYDLDVSKISKCLALVLPIPTMISTFLKKEWRRSN